MSTDTAVSWDGRDAGRSGMEKMDAAAQPLRELDPSLCSLVCSRGDNTALWIPVGASKAGHVVCPSFFPHCPVYFPRSLGRVERPVPRGYTWLGTLASSGLSMDIEPRLNIGSRLHSMRVITLNKGMRILQANKREKDSLKEES